MIFISGTKIPETEIGSKLSRISKGNLSFGILNYFARMNKNMCAHLNGSGAVD